MTMVKVRGFVPESGIFGLGGFRLYLTLRDKGPCNFSELYDEKVFSSRAALYRRLDEGQASHLIAKTISGVEQVPGGRILIKYGEKPEEKYELTPSGLEATNQAEKLEKTIKAAKLRKVSFKSS